MLVVINHKKENTMSDTHNDTAQTKAIGMAMTVNSAKLEPVVVEDHHPVMVVHDEMGLKGLEEFAEKPYRVKEVRTFQTEKAISAYIQDFKTDDTRVFGDLRNQELEAVFDYHGKDGKSPSWCGHKAQLKLMKDADYNTLLSLNNQWQTQQSFVNSMVDLSSFITHIDGKPASKADFLELVRDLKGATASTVEGQVGTSSVSAKSSYTSGVTSSKGALPENLTMKLPVFLGEEAVDHTFRIGTNATEGLRLRVELIRPEKVREEAFRSIVQRVQDNGGVKVYGL